MLRRGRKRWALEESSRRLPPLPRGLTLPGRVTSCSLRWLRFSYGCFGGVRRGQVVALLLLPAVMLLLVLPAETVVPGKGETSGQLALYRSLSSSIATRCRPCLTQDCPPLSLRAGSGPINQLCCLSTPCEVDAAWNAARVELLASSSVSEISSINSAQGPAILATGIAATCLLLFLLAVIVGLLMASSR